MVLARFLPLDFPSHYHILSISLASLVLYSSFLRVHKFKPSPINSACKAAEVIIVSCSPPGNCFTTVALKRYGASRTTVDEIRTQLSEITRQRVLISYDDAEIYIIRCLESSRHSRRVARCNDKFTVHCYSQFRRVHVSSRREFARLLRN